MITNGARTLWKRARPNTSVRWIPSNQQNNFAAITSSASINQSSKPSSLENNNSCCSSGFSTLSALDLGDRLVYNNNFNRSNSPNQLSEIFNGVHSDVEIKHIYKDSLRLLEELGNTSRTNSIMFAYERLVAMEIAKTKDKIGVLFLCGHNAGRSQMAAAMMSEKLKDCCDGNGPAIAFSGGSIPGNEVNPVVMLAMEEIGISLSSSFPKPWTAEVANASTMVITMGCGDKCPVLPGQLVTDWALEDPHGQGIEPVRLVRDAISVKVDKLVAEILKYDTTTRR